jgi:hypothetical protein
LGNDPTILGKTQKDSIINLQKNLSALKKKGKCIKLTIIRQMAESRNIGIEHI